MSEDTTVETTEIKKAVADLGDFVDNLDAFVAILEKIQKSKVMYDPRLDGVDRIARAQAEAFRRLVAEVEQLPDVTDWETLSETVGRSVEGFKFQPADPVERQVALVETVYKIAWG